MNTRSLSEICRGDAEISRVFEGVFPSDCLPSRLPCPSAFIVNTDPKSKPGKHWIAFYVDQDYLGDHLDSFGRHPIPTVEKYLDDKCIEWQYSVKQLQSPLTTTCGQYCIYFLHQRCRGKSMETILKRFSDDYASNDQFVKNFVNKVYDRNTKAVDVDYIVDQVASVLDI